MERVIIKLEDFASAIHVKINEEYKVSLCNDGKLKIWNGTPIHEVYSDRWYPEDFRGEVNFELNHFWLNPLIIRLNSNVEGEGASFRFYPDGKLEYYGGIQDNNRSPKYSGRWC